MSESGSSWLLTERAPGLRRLAEPRALALAGGTMLTMAYLSVLHRVVDVAGSVAGTGALVALVVGAGALGLVAARLVGPRVAIVLGGLLLVAGLTAYVLAVPTGALDLQRRLADTIALLTGFSILQMTEAGLWALGFAPAPVFLTAYFLARRSYVAAVAAGGAALGFIVLTGDADTVLALVGVLGAIATVGFGQLDREGANPPLRNGVAVVLVAALVLTTSVSLVPGGEARPLLPDRGGTTVETSLTDSTAEIDVQGSITLSPTARFTVTADEPRYWRVGAYDRYTGDGWIRTGEARPYDGELDPPPAEAVQPVRQRFRVESSVSTMPAAWKPVRVETGADRARVTDLGGLEPAAPFDAGETYSVVSLAPETPPSELVEAGTDYPDGIEERYLGLPESTPARLGQFTANLTADTDSPYQTAATIQRWLQTNKRYSLDVDRPSGDVATAFVFDMEAGYCTYYATAMVAMLRTQGIPARFAVGYLPGDRVGENQWLVRGFDSHAWVEVYVPETGWVRFDPTPAAPRATAERDALQTARDTGVENVDTSASSGPSTPIGAVLNDSGNAGAFNGTNPGPIGGVRNSTNSSGSLDPFGGALAPGREGGSDSGIPTEMVLYGVVLLIGAVTAVVRLGLAERLYRWAWLRRLPDGPPAARVTAALERLEYVLGRRHRPREPAETRREYLAALESAGVDERASRLYELGERARHAGRATDADARDARRLLSELLA